MDRLKEKISSSVKQVLKVYLTALCLRMFFLGFSAGLPLLLVIGTLGFWLREAGIDLKTIGFMSWIGLIYGCKWLWAPIVDNVPIVYFSRKLGQRRAWLLLSQVFVIVGLLGLAFSNPAEGLVSVAGFALLTAFASATQDISLDAFRIESAPVEMQAALAATYQTGYRIAMIWAGAGSFALAAFYAPGEGYHFSAWTFAYCIMACSIGLGLVTTIFSPRPLYERKESTIENVSCETKKQPLKGVAFVKAKFLSFFHWFSSVCLRPFADFLIRYKWQALFLLLLIATYRISDIVMGVMSNPFYQDLGFTKQEIATVSKIFGVVMSLAGAFIGGAIVMKIGVMKTLFLGAVLSSVTNLLFSVLTIMGHNVSFLVVTISADNLAGGIASAAFIAFLSGLTNLKYSATQYALFSSIMLILPKFLAGFSGVIVESIGYQNFFIFTAVLGVPVILLIPFIGKYCKLESNQSKPN